MIHFFSPSRSQGLYKMHIQYLIFLSCKKFFQVMILFLMLNCQSLHLALDCELKSGEQRKWCAQILVVESVVKTIFISILFERYTHKQGVFPYFFFVSFWFFIFIPHFKFLSPLTILSSLVLKRKSSRDSVKKKKKMKVAVCHCLTFWPVVKGNVAPLLRPHQNWPDERTWIRTFIVSYTAPSLLVLRRFRIRNVSCSVLKKWKQ